MNKSTKIILAISLSGVLALGYYMVIFEPHNLQIKHQEIALKNLPQSFDGLKIVHLTDTQSLWFGSREKRVLEILQELEPDFVFITGDFVDTITRFITDRDLSSVKMFWQKLADQHGDELFVVLGNHDPEIVKIALKDSGVRILDNEHEKLFLGGDYIYLVGVDDPFIGRDDLEKAMEGVEPGVPKILLAHAAEIIGEAAQKKIDLVLVGNTHGGQVNIPFVPFLGRLVQPLSEYGKKYKSGLFNVDGVYLYVSPGVGTSGIPVRFNSPPEITIIELKAL